MLFSLAVTQVKSPLPPLDKIPPHPLDKIPPPPPFDKGGDGGICSKAEVMSHLN